MKQRFSSLDVKVISHELAESLCGLRLSNIYDLSSQIFLLKFAKPNVRKQVVVDSGFRCHLTDFTRTAATQPSAFVARLRKFLRTRRVTAVTQVGTDRVIEFRFSDGRFKLFLEFYATGNIILTDEDLTIISLWRIVEKSEGQEELRVGLKYLVESRQNFGGVPPLTDERVRNGLQRGIERAASSASSKKGKQKPGDAIRRALAGSINEFPPVLIDHALALKHFDFTKSVEDVLNDEHHFRTVIEALQTAQGMIDTIMSSKTCTGYIIAKSTGQPKQATKADSDGGDVDKENDAILFDDFHPFLPKQADGQPGISILKIDGYNATVDRFFSSIESQTLAAKLKEQHDKAHRKLQATRNDHAARVEGLQQVQHLNVRKAQAIEGNIHWVSEACAAVNGLIAQGMDWVEIARLIEMEQSRHNPVSQFIKLPLKLHENTVTLLLVEEASSDEGDDESMSDRTDSETSDAEDGQRPSQPVQQDTRLSVDIDLALSPWANARLYYEQKKSAATKEEKTKQSSAKALKSAENKVKIDLQKDLKKEKDVLRPVRKQLWFEKFYYFISSEGYLVVAGRDKAQTDILYTRYFQARDAWVHSDVKGAAPVIVKNKQNSRTTEIPLLTLSQAGSFSVISSTAWDTKAVMGAWWVGCKQVTKLDSTGQYLGQGDFIIKGEKNHLPPAQLLLGFGVMFRVTPENKTRHMRHRMPNEGDDTIDNDDDTEATGAKANKFEQLDEQNPLQDTSLGEDEGDMSEDTAAVSDPEPELSDTEDGYNGHPSLVNSLQNPNTTRFSSNSIGPQMHDLKIHEDDAEGNKEAEDSSSDDEDDQTTEAQDSVQAKAGVESSDKNSPSVRSQTPSTVSKAEPQVRGKRGKRAKMKSKYADQDEEDRELAMQLLGSRQNPDKPAAAAETKIDREAMAAQQKERRREQHQRTQDSGKASEEARQKAIAAGEELMTPEELAELGLVDNFVGIPHPGDELLDCLVVCGPWDAMGSRLRWKTKLQPGTVKKGKAMKEILTNWNKFITDKEKRKPNPEKDDFEEEAQLRKQGDIIKSLRDVEVVGTIPVSKVRLITGGAGEKGKGGKQGAKGGRGGSKKKR